MEQDLEARDKGTCADILEHSDPPELSGTSALIEVIKKPTLDYDMQRHHTMSCKAIIHHIQGLKSLPLIVSR